MSLPIDVNGDRVATLISEFKLEIQSSMSDLSADMKIMKQINEFQEAQRMVTISGLSAKVEALYTKLEKNDEGNKLTMKDLLIYAFMGVSIIATVWGQLIK